MASNAEMCRHCGLLFHNKSSLKQHEGRHTGKAPHECCGQPFFSKANLNRHMCNVHGEPKPFQCSTCEKAFPTNADLQRHVRREIKEWAFTCDICNEKFPSKGKLTDHIDKHNNNKRHICETCGRAFRYQSNLSRHKNLHKEDTS